MGDSRSRHAFVLVPRFTGLEAASLSRMFAIVPIVAARALQMHPDSAAGSRSVWEVTTPELALAVAVTPFALRADPPSWPQSRDVEHQARSGCIFSLQLRGYRTN